MPTATDVRRRRLTAICAAAGAAFAMGATFGAAAGEDRPTAATPAATAQPPGETPAPGGATPTATVPDDSGEIANIVMYIDYLCPFCGQFEATNSDSLRTMVESGAATRKA